MPIARIGYGTDFILENQAVGVATDTSDRTGLYVGGTTKANYNISGIASLSNYAGFAAAEQSIDGTVTLTGEHSTLGDIVVGLGSTAIISTGSTVEVGTVLGIISQGNVKVEKKEEVQKPKNKKIEKIKLPENKSNIINSYTSIVILYFILIIELEFKKLKFLCMIKFQI